MAKKLKPTGPKVSVQDTTDKRPPLPQSILEALPTAKEIYTLVAKAGQMHGRLLKELIDAEKAGAIPMARAFVVLHRLKTLLDETVKPFDKTFAEFKDVRVPAVFETAGVPNVPLDEGFRVGVSTKFRASFKSEDDGGDKDAAYQWLRDNGLGDLITSTVNASTLSSAAKNMLENENKELPSTLFNVAFVPNTSVNTTK